MARVFISARIPLMLLSLLLTSALSYDAASPLHLPDTRSYEEVSWLCSHNAMSNKEEKWLMPNQLWSIETQLQRGIHAQMWDIWYDDDGVATLRHGNGRFFDPGERRLDSACHALEEYLRKHPRAIITLILESKVDENDILASLQRSGAARYLYHPATHRSWPTLGKLRADNTRLLVFIDRRSAHFFPLWDHAVETDWVNRHPDKLNNKLRRGQPQHALFVANHFVCNPLPSQRAAQLINRRTALQSRAQQLQQLYQRRVNFWTLDFIGVTEESFSFIAEQNRLVAPRKESAHPASSTPTS